MKVRALDSNGWIVEAESTALVQAQLSLPSVSSAPVIATNLMRQEAGTCPFVHVHGVHSETNANIGAWKIIRDNVGADAQRSCRVH